MEHVCLGCITSVCIFRPTCSVTYSPKIDRCLCLSPRGTKRVSRSQPRVYTRAAPPTPRKEMWLERNRIERRKPEPNQEGALNVQEKSSMGSGSGFAWSLRRFGVRQRVKSLRARVSVIRAHPLHLRQLHPIASTSQATVVGGVHVFSPKDGSNFGFGRSDPNGCRPRHVCLK